MGSESTQAPDGGAGRTPADDREGPAAPGRRWSQRLTALGAAAGVVVATAAVAGYLAWRSDEPTAGRSGTGAAPSAAPTGRAGTASTGPAGRSPSSVRASVALPGGGATPTDTSALPPTGAGTGLAGLAPASGVVARAPGEPGTVLLHCRRTPTTVEYALHGRYHWLTGTAGVADGTAGVSRLDVLVDGALVDTDQLEPGTDGDISAQVGGGRRLALRIACGTATGDVRVADGVLR